LAFDGRLAQDAAPPILADPVAQSEGNSILGLRCQEGWKRYPNRATALDQNSYCLPIIVVFFPAVSRWYKAQTKPPPQPSSFFLPSSQSTSVFDYQSMTTTTIGNTQSGTKATSGMLDPPIPN
jgi:hypothetical protein